MCVCFFFLISSFCQWIKCTITTPGQIRWKKKLKKKNPNNFKSWILMVHGKKWKRSCINRVCVMFWLWFHLGIVIQPFLYYIYSILKNFNLIFYVWNLLIFSNMFVHEKKKSQMQNKHIHVKCLALWFPFLISTFYTQVWQNYQLGLTIANL